jgi:hypothetical protein
MRAPPEAANRMNGVFFSTARSRHAERARHEAEVLGGGDDIEAVELALAHQDGVLEIRCRLGVAQPVRVAAPVAELEGILRHGGCRDLLELAAVEEVDEARVRPHAHVEVGPGHHELVGLEILVENHLPGLRAFHPQIVRHLALRREEVADLGSDDVVDPVHALWPLTSRTGSSGALTP